MSRPVIGILALRERRITPAGTVYKTFTNQAYVDAVIQAGGCPLLIPAQPQEDQLQQTLSLCQGLLFPGGWDVDPSFYGQGPMPQLGETDPVSDRAWLSAYRFAQENKLFILGICRGMQLCNVADGGDLYQDVSYAADTPLLHLQKQERSALLHQVEIMPRTLLRELLGKSALYTNTLHHQCVRHPGVGYRISAATSDGIIEGLEKEDRSVLLVQWHPEELLEVQPAMRNLFTYLVRRAEETQNRR